MEENKIMPVIGETRENGEEILNDFDFAFNHSYGLCFGGGMLCWENRHKGLTFFYSPSENDQNEEYKMFIMDGQNNLRDVITDSDKAFSKGSDEHCADGWPHIVLPTDIALTNLVIAFAKLMDESGRYEEMSRRNELEHFCIDFLIPRSSNNKIIYRRQIPEGVPDYIRKMDYKDFLETPYWKQVVRDVKAKKGNRCELCGSSSNLEVHHPDYSIHGYEIDNEDRLTLLCHECHSRFHNMEK